MSLPTVNENKGFPKCVHLSIEFNRHAVYCEPLEEWIDDQEWLDWVSPEERAKAIATDSVWTCQWYPVTPVGFQALAASTYEALMAAVMA